VKHQFSFVARDVVARSRSVFANVDESILIAIQAIDVLEELVIEI